MRKNSQSGRKVIGEGKVLKGEEFVDANGRLVLV
jgi:hypothetical protein